MPPLSAVEGPAGSGKELPGSGRPDPELPGGELLGELLGDDDEGEEGDDEEGDDCDDGGEDEGEDGDDGGEGMEGDEGDDVWGVLTQAPNSRQMLAMATRLPIVFISVLL